MTKKNDEGIQKEDLGMEAHVIDETAGNGSDNNEDLTLQNGGEFQENFRRVIKVKFEGGQNSPLQLTVEEKAGDLRKAVINTINGANITLNNVEHRFNYDDDKWARARVYERNLTDGIYDFDKGQTVAKATREKQIIGTFRLPIEGTNLIVRDISLGKGHYAWVYYCHPNAPTGRSNATTNRNDIDKQIETI